MQSTAAALTMVRDDLFFLRLWLRHYGGALGRENCYVVNHGNSPDVARLAEGCNVIAIPGEAHVNFDARRWRLLNNLVQGLRNYYRHVIVGDVDELVALDPALGTTLAEFLRETPGGQVITPLGLEVIHRIDIESEPVGDTVLGPRRHVRPAPDYSKPCIVSAATKISRGGHFSRFDRLNAPEGLYLFHLKYCDFETYVTVTDARNAMAASLGVGIREAGVGRHWFARTRGEDRARFEAFAGLELREGFDLDWLRDEMRRTWRPRRKTGYWEFERPDYAVQYRLPDRFVGLL